MVGRSMGQLPCGRCRALASLAEGTLLGSKTSQPNMHPAVLITPCLVRRLCLLLPPFPTLACVVQNGVKEDADYYKVEALA